MNLTQVDVTWNYADAAVWSAVEPNVAVISACLPMLRPVLKLIGVTFSSVGSLRKSPRHTASTAGTVGSDHPHWRTNTVPTRKDGGPFARLALGWPRSHHVLIGSTEKSGSCGKAEGVGGGVQKLNTIGRSDGKDMLGRAELGAVPRGAIHVRNEISLRDDKSSS